MRRLPRNSFGWSPSSSRLKESSLVERRRGLWF
ncbi:hypothetical protein PanWU01x14_070720 [Parasponia andersonii]|uniref:Uncharacterized protein n=1 Tax=Parasponia andersonii TaxID=3476 RepID=A0A2P5DF05_PARAD|nr:hypothetical protein PanWU01x14_070720 [Parasponia andersonii]